MDVPVGDSPDPLPELRRLARLALAHQRLDVSDGLLARGDMARAAQAHGEAADRAPGCTDLSSWQAAALAGAGDAQAVRHAWAAVAGSDDAARRRDLLERVIAVGLVAPRARAALRDEHGWGRPGPSGAGRPQPVRPRHVRRTGPRQPREPRPGA